MHYEFEERFSLKLDFERNRTYVKLQIPLLGGIQNFQRFDWVRYFQRCRESLHAFADQQGLEIIVWSVDVDQQYSTVSHYIAVRGVLRGTLPLRLGRTLRPTRDYWVLAFFAVGVQKQWPVGSMLNRAVESQKLHRLNRKGKRLEQPLPAQLLMRAITETDWERLIGPSDKPWAYINTATKRIYERQYQIKKDSISAADPDNDVEPYDDSVDRGDELDIPDFRKTLRAAGISEDAIAVLMAKVEGHTWSDLPSHLSNLAGKPISAHQVEAARGELRRSAKKIRQAVMAASTFKPRSSSSTVYKERLPDGELWEGLWTYKHKYQGEELELMRLIMIQERRNLYKN